MAVTVERIYEFLDKIAPFSTQMGFDNAGFLVGRAGKEVSRILLSLDITEEVAAEAEEFGAQLIVSHHPVLFHPAKSVTDADPTGRILLSLAEGHISAICAHTNLDVAQGGVNDALARRLELTGALAVLDSMGTDCEGRTIGIGRIGNRPANAPASLKEYAAWVMRVLQANGLRYADAGRAVERVAVGGGACGDMVGKAVSQGCDTLITSDVKYNQFLDAKALGLNLIDAGHYPTEQVVCPVLLERLQGAFPEVEMRISRRHREVCSYFAAP